MPTGTVDVEATAALKPATYGAWKNLRELDPSLPEDPLDPALLRQGLGPQASVRLSDQGTTMSFPMSNPKKMLPGLKTGTNSWELTLDRTTVRQLADLTSWAASPALDALLPSEGTVISESEYRDLLSYLLGPAVQEAAARRLIDASVVQLTVVAPRPLRSAEGSLSFSGNTAVFRWPLVRVLTLDPPLRLKLVF